MSTNWVTGSECPNAARASPNAATYAMVMSRTPPTPTVRRPGLANSHVTRGHAWSRVGRTRRRSQRRTGATAKTSATAATVIPMAHSMPSLGEPRRPVEPVTTLKVEPGGYTSR